MTFRKLFLLSLVLILASCRGAEIADTAKQDPDAAQNTDNVGSEEQTLAEAGEPHVTPHVPAGRTLVVLGQAVEPPVTASMSDYTEHLGVTPAGFMFYLIMSGDLERTRSELATIATFMDRYPGTVLQLGLGYGPELTQNIKESGLLLAGFFDAELDAIGEWLKSRDHAIFLRTLYEFDRIGGTYGPPELYKPAYRYIVDNLRGKDLTNTAYVWHSAGPFVRTFDESGIYGGLSVTQLDLLTQTYGISPVYDLTPIADYYPGEGYVDYFAISYWGDGNGYTGRSPESYRDLYEQETRRLLREARELGLELMIGESTPWYIGTFSGEDSVEWFDGYFRLIEEFDIRMTSLIVAEWGAEGGNWGNTNGAFPADARIHPYPEVAERWLRGISPSRYVSLRDVCPQAQANGNCDVRRMNTLLGIAPQTERLTWSAPIEPMRTQLRWPNCPPPLLPGTGGWCLPVLPSTD
ncbi:MAG: hypothetical protein RIK85_12870 [Marinobacter sp.]